MTETRRFVGSDISKDQLDVVVYPAGPALPVPNPESGIATLVEQSGGVRPAAGVREATGDLELPAVTALAAAGLPVRVINPRQVREFARATGQLAKPDALDARILAHVAETLRPAPRALPDEATQALSAALTRRRPLIEMLPAAKNRRHTARPPVRQGIEAPSAWLAQELRRVDADRDTAIRQSQVGRAQDDLVQSMPGGGSGFSRTILAELPEMGTVSARHLAALVGVAPRNRDSGTLRGQRLLGGGRAVVRTALSMAALAATTWNPVIKAFDQHLLASGQAKKVALAACLPKLLTILNAMPKHRTPWRPNAQQA